MVWLAFFASATVLARVRNHAAGMQSSAGVYSGASHSIGAGLHTYMQAAPHSECCRESACRFKLCHCSNVIHILLVLQAWKAVEI